MLDSLREEVWRLHLELPKNGLVTWTSGNVSGRDPESGLVVIKPSGLMFPELTPENMAIVDIEGRTVLPGFIDPHSHVVAGSVVDAIMDYVGMAKYGTVDEVLAHIAARVAQAPAGEWLVFRNFDPAVQEGLDALTFADLDPISTDHPIFVLNASGHLAYANSRAFEAAGISADVDNPPGGEFHRPLQCGKYGFSRPPGFTRLGGDGDAEPRQVQLRQSSSRPP